MSYTLAEIRNGTGFDKEARFELVDTRRDEQYAAIQAIGKSAAESLVEMVAALECDYDVLETLRERRDTHNALLKEGNEQIQWRDTSEADELTELEQAAGECESRGDAEQRIQEDPLSILMRGDWFEHGTEPIDAMKPVEFEILLSTGGPATRIIGELSDGEPTRARLQAQDWGTAWTDYRGDAISQDDLLTYCRCFYFGE